MKNFQNRAKQIFDLKMNSYSFILFINLIIIGQYRSFASSFLVGFFIQVHDKTYEPRELFVSNGKTQHISLRKKIRKKHNLQYKKTWLNLISCPDLEGKHK